MNREQGTIPTAAALTARLADLPEAADVGAC